MNSKPADKYEFFKNGTPSDSVWLIAQRKTLKRARSVAAVRGYSEYVSSSDTLVECVIFSGRVSLRAFGARHCMAVLRT